MLWEDVQNLVHFNFFIWCLASYSFVIFVASFCCNYFFLRLLCLVVAGLCFWAILYCHSGRGLLPTNQSMHISR